MTPYFRLFQILAPEVILLITALVILAIGVSSTHSRKLITAFTLGGGLAALGLLILVPGQADILKDMLVLTPLAGLLKAVILGLGLITIVFAHESDVKVHFAEYIALILFALIGLMLLVGTEDLLMIFIALELASLPLYVLTAYRKRSPDSAEAGLKYFLIGGTSAAFLLFGLSFVCGVSGTTSLRVLSRMSPAIAGDPLMLVGIVLVLVGFGFKVAAVPFHLWAPDVYEGAPTSTAALVASGSKVAGFLILSKVVLLGFYGASGSAAWAQFRPGWLPVLALMAAASIVLGNLAALVQSNVKRLLAYSAIAHGGYMLLGLTPASTAGLAAVLFYVIVYALTTVGAFGVVALVERRRGGSQLRDFDGLYKTSPILALCLLVFLISLAGIPPLAGFFGKFFLFGSALAGTGGGAAPGMLWLVMVAIAMNAVSLYYYLIVLKHVFATEPAKDAQVVSPAPASAFLVVVLALAVVFLGILPGALLTPLRAAMGWKEPAIPAQSEKLKPQH